MRHLSLLLVILLATPLFAAKPAADLPRVVASTNILLDFVEHVGGDLVAADSLVPPGVDLHTFSPTPQDIAKLRDADLVVVNGLHLEGWIDEAIENSGFSGRIVVASNGIDVLAGSCEAHDHDHDHHHHATDPHAWLSPRNAMVYVKNISSALAELHAEAAEDYEANAALYNGQLRILDSWIKRQSAQIPAERRVLVTDHDAFAYFAQAYGFETHSVVGLSTTEEPSAKDLAQVVDTIRARDVGAVFVESAEASRLIERAAEEAGVSVAGPLYVGSLDPPGGLADTYIAMQRHNLRTIVRNLK